MPQGKVPCGRECFLSDTTMVSQLGHGETIVLGLFRWWNTRYGTYEGTLSWEENFQADSPEVFNGMFPDSSEGGERPAGDHSFPFRSLSPEEEAAEAQRMQDQNDRDFLIDDAVYDIPPPSVPKAIPAARSAFLPTPEAPPQEDDSTPHLTIKAATALAKNL